METHAIPSQEWKEFFGLFSRDHSAWPITIDIVDPRSGQRRIADSLPLESIRVGSDGAIEIDAGAAPPHHLRHVIKPAVGVQESREPDGTIDFTFESSADAPVTLLHLDHRA